MTKISELKVDDAVYVKYGRSTDLGRVLSISQDTEAVVKLNIGSYGEYIPMVVFIDDSYKISKVGKYVYKTKRVWWFWTESKWEIVRTES